MKTRFFLFITAVALLTLSFTFTTVERSIKSIDDTKISHISSEPVGGIIVDEVVK